MKKKYFIIVKVSNYWKDTTTGGAFWLNFHNVTDLIKFTKHLDDKYQHHWLYYNVHEKENNTSLAHFTKEKRPQSKHII